MDDVEALTHCLNTIELKIKDKVVIVPGGGVFADQVRLAQKRWEFDDETGHQMAILAMQQMALLFKSVKQSFRLIKNSSSIKQAFQQSAVIIWSPDIDELNAAAVATSWDVTSDSLAAWLANQLSAKELILVKSAKISRELNIKQMQQQGILDKAFNHYTKNSNYPITLINKHSFNEYAFT